LINSDYGVLRSGMPGHRPFAAPGGATNLKLVAASIVGGDDQWVLTAQWQGLKGRHQFISPHFSMTFQMANEQVAALRTGRADNTFVIGDSIIPPWPLSPCSAS
jgi:hypothetical protein